MLRARTAHEQQFQTCEFEKREASVELEKKEKVKIQFADFEWREDT